MSCPYPEVVPHVLHVHTVGMTQTPLTTGTLATGRDVTSQRQVTGRVIEHRALRGILGGLYVLDVADDPRYTATTVIAECVSAAR